MMKPNGRSWLMVVLGGVTVAAVSAGAGVVYSHERRLSTLDTKVAVLSATMDATMTAIHKELATIAASLPKEN